MDLIENSNTLKFSIKQSELNAAQAKGSAAVVDLLADSALASVGGQLTISSQQQLGALIMTLIAYRALRREVMDSGFVGLIYNGYGPFIFRNPLARSLKLMGAAEMARVVYDASHIFSRDADELTRPRTDDEFMALFEQRPDLERLDDLFIEEEEAATAAVAQYACQHIADMADVVADAPAQGSPASPECPA